MTTVLIADDEKDIRSALKIYLKPEGYELLEAADGKQALQMVKEKKVDLVLLDIMMPQMDGIETISRLREFSNIPVIFLSAKSEDTDRVMGLNVGADDYVTKPFSVPELLARIKTNLRRVSTTNQLTKKEYTFQDIRLDTIEKKVFRGENYIRLGPTEFRILKLLIANPRHVFSREDLLREVWGNSVYVETRTVDVHIRRLRKALNEFGADYIRTIRATGYSIDDHEVEAE